jgi:Na+-translocating ferredoxin:NAD+ oxidoreductase subunit C
MPLVADDKNALPCTRCGDCIVACPEQLNPHALMVALEQDDESTAQALGIDRCTECRQCDIACPSHIALSALFIAEKSRLRKQLTEREKRDAARLRFETRNQRLQRLAIEKVQLLEEKKYKATSVDAVAQALARAKAKREQNKINKHE